MTLVSPARRMLAMKPVGKPDAGNPHVRFDERGRETGLVQRLATAPFLDSTIPPQFVAVIPIGSEGYRFELMDMDGRRID